MSAARVLPRPVPALLQVQQAEGFSKRRLFEMLTPLEEQSRIIMQGARKRLAADKGGAAGQPWNENFMLSGDCAPGAAAGRTGRAALALHACSGQGGRAATWLQVSPLPVLFLTFFEQCQALGRPSTGTVLPM